MRFFRNPLLLLLAGVLFLLVAVHVRAQDADDDDDDRPYRPPIMRPDERPTGIEAGCPYAKNFRQPRKLGSYTIRLLRTLRKTGDRCRATLASSSGKVSTVASDWVLTINSISGLDINGDGQPELVIDGHSDGSHCCYTYTIITLGKSPKVLPTLHSQAPVAFEKQADGAVLIRARDSAFDYFLLPHFSAVIPQIVLSLEGDKLVDVSARYATEYDKLIAEARSQLTSADLDVFRRSRYGDKMFTDQIPTVHRVLTIVLNYLYSGRETEAWQALDELWPPSDRNRVGTLILERRGRGVRKQLEIEDSNSPQEASSK